MIPKKSGKDVNSKKSKAKVSPSEQGTKYVLHKKGIYEFFYVSTKGGGVCNQMVR